MYFSFQELNKKDIQNVSTILVSFGRCAKNLNMLGQSGLLTMIKQGLVQKISIEYVIYSYEDNRTKGMHYNNIGGSESWNTNLGT